MVELTPGARAGEPSPANRDTPGEQEASYKWVALSNTTLGSFMATLDGSIVIISLPAIFRGIGLDPLAPGNITYLLWMILGYLLATAALVVTFGRLGDVLGRVRIYNLGFAVFTAASLALSLDPLKGHQGALWLIAWRVVQAVGGSMLLANSTAILTDAFPARQRGMALGVNQVAALAGQFLGLLAGGLLAVIDWRAIFWINVPIGAAATIWSYRSLRDIGERRPARIDWLGSALFTVGVGALLVSITSGVQPYNGHSMGWLSPRVLGGLSFGLVTLAVFGFAESRQAHPIFRLDLLRIRAFAAGNLAALLTAVARGGLQFILILWLQGVWLPQHGYRYDQTPLWAGIAMLPLTAGFLVAGPLFGWLSDRSGQRGFATGGMLLLALSFFGLLVLPVNFSYLEFAVILLVAGLAQGMFSAPNTAAIMNAVPAEDRGVAAGMRSTVQNAGQCLSIGLFFSLMTVGLAASLPLTLSGGLRQHGVDAATAAHVAQLPPVSTIFATFLGDNPIAHLLQPYGTLAHLPASQAATLVGRQFFPSVISGPFHQGLMVAFLCATVMSVVGAVASLLRGPAPQRASAEFAGAASLPEIPAASPRGTSCIGDN